MQVRIQDLCKGGGASEILPTSRSRVAVATKIWASNLGVGGCGRAPSPPPPLDPHLIRGRYDAGKKEGKKTQTRQFVAWVIMIQNSMFRS